MEQMSEQALKNWQKVIRSGLRLQEQSSQWWTKTVDSASLAQDIQKRFTRFSTVASELMPEVNKQVEDALDLMGKNSQIGNELFKKCLDAFQMPVMTENHTQWMKYWGTCLEAIQSNNEAMLKMSNRAMNTWVQVAQKNGDAADEQPKAA